MRKKKPAKTSSLQMVAVKMTKADLRLLRRNARAYAEGNLSAWIRHAARAHTPKKGEKILAKAA